MWYKFIFEKRNVKRIYVFFVCLFYVRFNIYFGYFVI